MKKLLLIIILFVCYKPVFAQEPETDYIIIPDIGLYKSIGTVDLVNRSYDMSGVYDGVVRASNTAWNNTSWSSRTIMFGHTADDWGAFRNLENLYIGAEIIILTDQMELDYIVTDMRIVDPSDTSVFTAPSSQHELVLITCHDDAATRLIVTAVLK